MIRRLIFFLVWASTLVSGSVFGRQYNVSFDHIGMEDGLPARMVYRIVQDKNGFIWISTQLGIHRYDGYQFKNYSTSKLGLPSRVPPHIAVDGKNRLWISSHLPPGLRSKTTILDIPSGRFLSVEEATGGVLEAANIATVSSVHSSEEGVLVLLGDGRLMHYNGSVRLCGRFLDGFSGLVKAGDKGVYWCRGKAEIQELRDGEAAIRHSLKEYTPQHPTQHILVDGLPVIWMARPLETWNFTVDGGEIVPYTRPDVSPKLLRHPLVVTPQFFIYATKDSLIARDAGGSMIAAFPAFLNHTESDENRVFDIFTDRQSNTWLATVDGVYKISIQNNPFEAFNEGYSTHGILPEGDRLWVTDREFFTFLDAKTGRRNRLVGKAPMNSFLKDSKGMVLGMSLKGKVLRYNPQTEEIKTYPTKPKVSIRIAYEDIRSNTLYLGTEAGLFKTSSAHWEEDTLRLELLPGQEGRRMSVRSLTARGRELWAAGSLGLMAFDMNSETLLQKFGKEEGLDHADLNHIWIDTAGVFWMGARGGGLYRWFPRSGQLDQFTIEDGLSNDNIYAVVEDSAGDLWMPSDYGLMCFDKKTQNVQVFHKENGLLHEEFNTLSHAQDSSGYLYFGGLRGVVKFHPRELKDSKQKQAEMPTVLISGLKVLRRGSESYDDRLPAFEEAGVIELAPEDQLLEIQLSNLDFTGRRRKRLSYRLKGYSEKWVYPESNSISLMNPPYGSYELQVRTLSAKGIWRSAALHIPVHVSRPFYQQTWFRIAATLFICLLFLALMQLRTRSLKRSKKRMEVVVQKRTATIARQAEELKELAQVQAHFFSNITHELRTPLTLIIGPLEQVLSKPLTKNTPNRLRTVLKNSRSLLGLINQLLDVSKMESRKMDIQLTHGDIVSFTKELMDRFGASAEEQGIALNFEPAPAQFETQFDADKWEKIVNNLLSNALKFTPADGRIDVILVAKASSLVQLTVRDTGSGIPEEDLDKVFDRFYQPRQDPETAVTGTGIGLAFVKELVELLGGDVSVRSRLGEGAEFSVTLPLQALQTEIQSVTHPVAESGRLQILLIEDNPDLRVYIRSCFSVDRYDVYEAKNGREGLLMAQELVPDVVISDVMMPLMDGYQVTKAIREHLATSHIPIILLTAKSSLTSRLEGFRMGADVYLSKPFSSEELCLRVEKLIEIRELYKERFRPSRDPDSISESRKSPTEMDPSEQFMHDLKTFILDNLVSPDLSVSLIISHLGLSRAQFYRKLQSISDIGVSELIRSARCEAAIGLIRSREMSMTEIAYEVGFSSPSQFSTTFKSFYGRSPKEFQKDKLSLKGESN